MVDFPLPSLVGKSIRHGSCERSWTVEPSNELRLLRSSPWVLGYGRVAETASLHVWLPWTLKVRLPRSVRLSIPRFDMKSISRGRIYKKLNLPPPYLCVASSQFPSVHPQSPTLNFQRTQTSHDCKALNRTLMTKMWVQIGRSLFKSLQISHIPAHTNWEVMFVS